MFATEAFIEASRKFVCVRIETYENKQSEAMVRKLLNGRFENTAFCIFDPQGMRRLSRSGRSPSMGLSTGRGRERPDDESITQQMEQIAARYSAAGRTDEAVLQDFNSFRQALNVASADQRLLIFVNANESDRRGISGPLQAVLAEADIVGKFHLDFADAATDQGWARAIKGSDDLSGLLIIRAGRFGQDGIVMNRLMVTATEDEIKTALLDANQEFNKLERRKTYGTHVAQGRRENIYFENEIPYGEDRGGDGRPNRRRDRESR